MSTPTDAPPPYSEAAASSSSSTSRPSQTSHLQVPQKDQNGIPALNRRSMEDEGRDLPSGWIRQYDPQDHHQFFVDTNVEPPRSIWHHPYDDEQYLSTLDPAERQKVQHLPNHADVQAESSDDDHDHATHDATANAELPPREEKPSFGRRWKDKITNSTHEQREAQRAQRAEEERKTYQRHMELRQAMSRAAQTGEPQLVGKGRDGKDVYIEPPPTGPPAGAYGGGYGRGYGGGYGYNPYTRGPYSNPNATYIRPQYPYSRPYGGGYGGGYGLPIAGGLLGGLLLGDLLF